MLRRDLIFKGEDMTDQFFHEMKEKADEKNKKKTVVKENLSAEDSDFVDYLIRDVEAHIRNNASQGKYTFDYDCSKINSAVYQELLIRFKHQHPLFFVMTSGKSQKMTVDWSGYHDV